MELAFQELWELEDVRPLLKVPAHVLFAQKKSNAEAASPFPGQKLKGKLTQQNAVLGEAHESLTVEKVQFFLGRIGNRSFWQFE